LASAASSWHLFVAILMFVYLLVSRYLSSPSLTERLGRIGHLPEQENSSSLTRRFVL
jgi:hypothetical protein